MKSFLLFTLAALIIVFPMQIAAGPDEMPGETLVTMEISGMS